MLLITYFTYNLLIKFTNLLTNKLHNINQILTLKNIKYNNSSIFYNLMSELS